MLPPAIIEQRSAFPYFRTEFAGGETAALAHLQAYFATTAPSYYKETRNGLIGTTYSSKFSPWLAWGCLSARQIYQALQHYEQQYGANDSTYWLYFELLWRDYFRFLHLKYGRRLYHRCGLSQQPVAPFRASAWQDWINSQTGHPLIDAAMRELATTGYLSNRLRQVVASYWLHELAGDWRPAAAWFEAQLLDYDVCSNQGNWLYLAGRGTDPRGSRRFNPDKQATDYDRDGAYRRLWAQ